MDKASFLVQGSAAEPYKVIFKLRDDKNLSAYCTCQAGQKGTHCKHRINILRGEYCLSALSVLSQFVKERRGR
jgi:uncharacterized Zn finger protein